MHQYNFMGIYSLHLSCQTAGLPAIRLTATHRMSADIFASIVELGSQRKKAKRKGKKKVSKNIQVCLYVIFIFCRKNENYALFEFLN